jgi:hypothetical protein
MSWTNYKYKPARIPNHFQWFWQGRRLLGIVEQHGDRRWHVFGAGRDHAGSFPDRGAAIAFITSLSS